MNNKTQFIAGVAMLVLAASSVFGYFFKNSVDHKSGATASMGKSEARDARRNRAGQDESHSAQTSSQSQAHRGARSSMRQSRAETQQYQVGFRDMEVAQKVERESREKLADLSGDYRLSKGQRQKIFPILVAHHKLASEGMSVNGNSVDLKARKFGLLDSIYLELNSDQRILMENATVLAQLPKQEEGADDAQKPNASKSDLWWRDVFAKLEKNTSLVDRVTENSSGPDQSGDNAQGSNPSGESDQPAAGGGSGGAHRGGNLFGNDGK